MVRKCKQTHKECIIVGEFVLNIVDRLREELVRRQEITNHEHTSTECKRQQVIEYLITIYFKIRSVPDEILIKRKQCDDNGKRKCTNKASTELSDEWNKYSVFHIKSPTDNESENVKQSVIDKLHKSSDNTEQSCVGKYNLDLCESDHNETLDDNFDDDFELNTDSRINSSEFELNTNSRTSQCASPTFQDEKESDSGDDAEVRKYVSQEELGKKSKNAIPLVRQGLSLSNTEENEVQAKESDQLQDISETNGDIKDHRNRKFRYCNRKNDKKGEKRKYKTMGSVDKTTEPQENKTEISLAEKTEGNEAKTDLKQPRYVENTCSKIETVYRTNTEESVITEVKQSSGEVSDNM